VIVKGRWYWTNNREDLVPEGDPRAAFLAFPDGEEVGDDEAKRTDLVAKMQRGLSDKMARPVKNK
jgi:hypothetical protein